MILALILLVTYGSLILLADWLLTNKSDKL